MPALAPVVHEHPEETEAKWYRREPVTDVAQQRMSDRQRLAIRPRDTHAHQQLPGSLAEQYPEANWIANGNRDADERGDRDDDFTGWTGLENPLPNQSIQGEESQ
jgi:hypothetical protein